MVYIEKKLFSMLYQFLKWLWNEFSSPILWLLWEDHLKWQYNFFDLFDMKIT